MRARASPLKRISERINESRERYASADHYLIGMKSASVLLYVAVTALAAHQAQAWWCTGHMLVAGSAYACREWQT